LNFKFVVFLKLQFSHDPVQQTSRRARPGQDVGFDPEESQAPLRRKHVQLDGRRSGTFEGYPVQRQLVEASRRSQALRGNVPRLSRGIVRVHIPSSSYSIIICLFTSRCCSSSFHKHVTDVIIFQNWVRYIAHEATPTLLLRPLPNLQRYIDRYIL
jgi:hypothetical protein